MAFLSAAPDVRLTKAFSTPFQNVVATARTCYSGKGIVDDSQVGEPEKFAPLATSIYEAGHHTTFQHAHFQFALSNVSRQFIWAFLHAHPFYNSEQVSQRYVTVKPDTVTVPELPAAQLAIYRECVERQFADYKTLSDMLEPVTEAQYYRRFNRSERMEKKNAKAIEKKAQEAARYVLPLATHAYLYHTVSGITLLRYHRALEAADAPTEQRFVVCRMVEELLAHDPNYRITLEEPLPPEAIPDLSVARPSLEESRRFCAAFDARLAGHTSHLRAHTPSAAGLVADAVREVLGLSPETLSDEDAIALALDPARNTLLGESLNLTTHHKLSRALHHVSFTFAKKLSHAADSQDQRHRMTPASRPWLGAQLHGEPDFVTPALIGSDAPVKQLYEDSMARTWDAINRLRALGATEETLLYLLPNAVSVRFTESSDLLNLRHKHQMRLCYNAQEEIWNASVDEARQIRAAVPELGRFLLPPCGVRALARKKPICPEGPRYCGVRVWKLDMADYERLI